MSEIRGSIRIESCEQGSIYSIDRHTGGNERLVFASKALKLSAPINRDMYLRVEKRRGFLFVPVQEWRISNTLGEDRANLTKLKSVRAVIVRQAGAPKVGSWHAGYSNSRMTDQEAVDDAAMRVEGWLRQWVGEMYDVEVRGYVLDADHSPARGHYYVDEMERLRGHILDGYDWNYVHAWGGSSSSYCGWGRVGSVGSMTFATCTDPISTMCHELGHNFKLKHSQSQSNGEVREYGDRSCQMGSGEVGWNVVQMEKLGIIHVPTVGSGSFIICDRSNEIPFLGESRAIKHSDTYYSAHANTLYQHMYDFPNPVLLNHWSLSERTELDISPETKITATPMKYGRVNLQINTDQHSSQDAWAFNPRGSANVAAGLYWTNRHQEQGLHIKRLGDRINVLWLTYDASGDPVWYMGGTTADSGIMQLISYAGVLAGHAALWLTDGGLAFTAALNGRRQFSCVMNEHAPVKRHDKLWGEMASGSRYSYDVNLEEWRAVFNGEEYVPHRGKTMQNKFAKN
jgi:hypothetical protein